MEKKGEKRPDGPSLAFRKPASRPAESVVPLDSRSVTSSGGQRWTLGSTQGMFAAGAWAARHEVAHLLEARCDPSELVKMVKSGEEGQKPLSVGGDYSFPPDSETAEISEAVVSPESPKFPLGNILEGEGLDKQIESHNLDEPRWLYYFITHTGLSQ